MNYFEVMNEIRSREFSERIKEGSAQIYVTFKLQEGGEDSSTTNRPITACGTLKYFPGFLNKLTGKQMPDFLAMDSSDTETHVEQEMNLSPVYVPVKVKSFRLMPAIGAGYHCSFGASCEGDSNFSYFGEIIFGNAGDTTDDWDCGEGDGLFLHTNEGIMFPHKDSFDLRFDSILIAERAPVAAEAKRAA